MRGQISLEYLFLFVISLVLISFSIFALSKIKEAADVSYDLRVFNSSVNQFYNTAEELCAMGNGNKRTITLQSEIELSGNEFSHSGYVLEREFTCELDADGRYSGEITIENDDGKIVIK